MPFLWLPVEPILEPVGDSQTIRRLQPLTRTLGSGDEATITLLREDQVDGTWESTVHAGGRSSQFTTSLRVGAVGSVAGTYAYETVIFDGMVGRKIRNEAPGSKIKEVFWGVGLRIALTYRAGSLEAGLTFAAVAAKAEAKAIDVQYNVHGTGLGPRSLARVLRAVPPFGTFNLRTFARLDRAKNDMVEEMLETLSPSTFQPASPPGTGSTDAENEKKKAAYQAELRAARNQLVPAVVLIDVDAENQTNALQNAAAWRFAMLCVRAELSFEQAKASLANSHHRKHVAAEKLEQVYKEHFGAGFKPDAAPNHKQLAAARAWLRTT